MFGVVYTFVLYKLAFILVLVLANVNESHDERGSYH